MSNEFLHDQKINQLINLSPQTVKDTFDIRLFGEYYKNQVDSYCFSIMKLSTDKLLTIGEVAKILRVSERSVNRYIKAGRLRASKIGWWRINKKDLNEFMDKTSNLYKKKK